jgi:hypothetical protein
MGDMDYRITVLEDCCMDRDEELHRVLMEKVFARKTDVVSAKETTIDSAFAQRKSISSSVAKKAETRRLVSTTSPEPGTTLTTHLCPLSSHAVNISKATHPCKSTQPSPLAMIFTLALRAEVMVDARRSR